MFERGDKRFEVEKRRAKRERKAFSPFASLFALVSYIFCLFRLWGEGGGSIALFFIILIQSLKYQILISNDVKMKIIVISGL